MHAKTALLRRTNSMRLQSFHTLCADAHRKSTHTGCSSSGSALSSCGSLPSEWILSHCCLCCQSCRFQHSLFSAEPLPCARSIRRSKSSRCPSPVCMHCHPGHQHSGCTMGGKGRKHLHPETPIKKGVESLRGLWAALAACTVQYCPRNTERCLAPEGAERPKLSPAQESPT